MRASPGFPNEGEVKERWSEIVPPLQLWKKYKYFFQVKKGGKYSGAAQSLWPSARAWFFLFYLQRSFFVCSVPFLFAVFVFCLQRSFFVCSISVICSRHLLFTLLVFICSVLFFICSVLFYLQRTFFICSVFFFVCSVSFLFAACPLWAIVTFW